MTHLWDDINVGDEIDVLLDGKVQGAKVTSKHDGGDFFDFEVKVRGEPFYFDFNKGTQRTSVVDLDLLTEDDE